MHYQIEAMEKSGRWYIRGTDATSGWAQHYMREMQRLEPKTAFRVVARPSGQLIVCHDPNGEPFAGKAA